VTASDDLRLAREAWDAADWPRVATLYERLATDAPDDPRTGAWWYDAALAQKFLRNWPAAYRLGVHAAARADRGAEDPAFWNLGIAATILRDWTTARAAWVGYGITLPPGEGPIDGDFGRACVRLGADGRSASSPADADGRSASSPAGGAEVVWVQRLCPTRARVINVPFDTSRRYGEVVVHDGEPKGDRVVGNRTYRVFDELTLFEPSELPTLSVTVTAAEPSDLDALGDLLQSHDLGFEPLRHGVVLCKCCSEGSVEQERVPLSGQQRCLIAAPPDRAREILDSWQSSPGRAWHDLHPAT
jgi:hypothetical protein